MKALIAGAAVLLALGGAAAADASVPGRYVVKGKSLVKGGGRSVSVFARPAAVVVEGCRSRSPRVRSRRGRVSASARVACERVRGSLRLQATIRGKRMRGTLGKRRFTASLRAPAGVVLRGRGRALAAVRDTDKLARHSGNEISLGRGVVETARTEIELLFRRRATVRQVNAALNSVGGRIAGSLEDSPSLQVAIPDPGSLAALDAVIRSVAKRAGVQRAGRAEMADTFVLPPNLGSPLPAASASALSHLLALRAPAAWNARRAIQLSKRPTLIVTDQFGDGALSSYLDASCPGCVLGRGNAEEDSHGYHVTGIAAANFANDGTQRGLVTGTFPATTQLKVIDLADQTVGAGKTRTLQAVKDTAGRVVLNTSWGHSENSDRDARDEGSEWQFDIRSAGLTSRLVHAAAGGNEARPADLFSYWNAAALRADLVDPDGASAPRLQNTIVAENLVDSGAPAFDPGCLGLSSNRSGQIAAVGTEVFSHQKRNSGVLLPAGAGNLSGTSQASPQVAALAEYAWSIAPDLTPAQIVSMLIATARDPVSSCAPLAPGVPAPTSAKRLDAYAAVLSLDKGQTPAEAPVRFAILNDDDSVSFDHADLATHAARIAAGNNGARDWGRSDLNGDGFTGVGSGSLPGFDLDPSLSTRAQAPGLGSITQSIEGTPVTFNETAVSDLEVLCFYAYSGLYGGDPGQRQSLLAGDLEGCGLPLTVTPSAATLAPGATAQFSAKSGNATDSTVAWAATAGSISAGGLYTAPSTPGTYTVAATDVNDPARSGTATVTVTSSGLGGKYLGTSTLCETEPVMECFEPEHTKTLLVVSGNDFTLYWRAEGMGFGTSFPTADCNDPPSPTCAKYAGTRSGSHYTGAESGTGVDPNNADTIAFDVVGETMSGRIDDPPNGNGDFIDFSLTHDPD
jgi:hypothetical protein